MNKLKKYAGLLNEEAPKDHFLAYITASERDMLVEAGGKKTPTESGIFAYPYWDDGSGQSKSEYDAGGGYDDKGNQNTGSNNNNNNSGNDNREQYIVDYSSKGIVKGGGKKIGYDKDGTPIYENSTVDPEVVQRQKEEYAEQFGGVAPLGSRPVNYSTKYEYNQMKYIADSKLDTIKAKLKQAGFTDFNKDATLSEMKEYVTTLNRTGKIGDSWKNAKDTKGNALYSPETIAEWESLGYVPQSPTLPAPGLFGKLMEKASPSGSLGSPLTYDQLLADFDTITEVGQSQGMGFQERMKTYQPNRYASMTGMNYNPKTKTFTMKDGGGSEQDAYTRIAAPYELTDTTPQESMVNEYFSNMNQGSSLSYDLQTDYNNAKSKVNSILGIVSPDQQFGYSNDPYSGLLASNVATNPFNIPYLKQRGLI
jgi:hypothetical protein